MTLLQNRPIHLLQALGKNVIARTYCGVDPYRKGVKTEGVNVGLRKATCPHCLSRYRQNSAPGQEIDRYDNGSPVFTGDM